MTITATEEEATEALRPDTLANYIGQPEVKEHVAIMIEAAKYRGQPVDHMLFAGPPGLGKTTLACIIANEMGTQCHITSAPAIKTGADLGGLLGKLEEGDIFFMDEIHQMARPVEEVLYPAMEDFQIDMILGKGDTARSIRMSLPRFTLVGATTRTGEITGPLRDRFGLLGRLQFYSVEDLAAIVARSAGILDVECTGDAAAVIASRSRGTPRIANKMLRRVRDFAQARRAGVIDATVADEGLTVFGVDDRGLDDADRSVLRALCGLFNGGPVGLKSLAVAISEPVETLEDVYEPFLIQQGLLMRTGQGRVATPAGWAHIGLTPPG